MAAEETAANRDVPRGLETFREREPKALAVSLLMSAVMLLMSVIPVTTVSDSSIIRTGVPIVTALLFTLSGTLTMVTEQRPSRRLGLSTAAALLLSAVTGAAGAVAGLMDIHSLRAVPASCSFYRDFFRCHRRTIGQATLISSMPAVYVLTLYGTLLCVVLSTVFFEFLRIWGPNGDGILRPAATPEGAKLEPGACGSGDPAEPREPPGVRASPPRRRVLHGERFLQCEPKLLGVVLLTVSFGLVLLSMPDLVLQNIETVRLGLVWWSFVHNVVSGVLAIVAAEYPRLNLIRSCFVLNILSAVVSSIVGLAYVDLNMPIMFCFFEECEDPIIFSQHVFPFLLLILSTVLSSVLAAYARKDLRALSLDKATLIVNPTPAPEQSGSLAPQE